jgi:hypothetical protein
MDGKYIAAAAVAATFFLASSGSKKKNKLVVNDIVNDLAKHPTKVYPTRNLSQVTEIILHHYASSGTPYAVARYHVKPEEWVGGKNVGGRNWAGIGYHYTIDKDGTVSLVNYHDTYSNHTLNHNYKSIGVALEGNFKNENPTDAQMKSLNALIAHIRSQIDHPLEVYQHSDFANKPYDASLDLTPYKLAHIGTIYQDYNEDYFKCQDGTYTDSTAQGACSHNGGLYDELNLITDEDLETYFFKEYAIAEFLEGRRVSVKSFKRYGDSNLIREKLNWIKKGGLALDDAAQQLTWKTGIEITPNDLIEVVLDFKSPKDYIEHLKYGILDLYKRGGMIGAIFENDKCPEFLACKDGIFSTVRGRGACAHHGGLATTKAKKKPKKSAPKAAAKKELSPGDAQINKNSIGSLYGSERPKCNRLIGAAVLGVLGYKALTS